MGKPQREVELDQGSIQGAAFQHKREDAEDEVVTTIISAAEQLRGWLAQIHRQHDPQQQIVAYQRLRVGLVVISIICLVPFFTLIYLSLFLTTA